MRAICDGTLPALSDELEVSVQVTVVLLPALITLVDLVRTTFIGGGVNGCARGLALLLEVYCTFREGKEAKDRAEGLLGGCLRVILREDLGFLLVGVKLLGITVPLFIPADDDQRLRGTDRALPTLGESLWVAGSGKGTTDSLLATGAFIQARLSRLRADWARPALGFVAERAKDESSPKSAHSEAALFNPSMVVQLKLAQTCCRLRYCSSGCGVLLLEARIVRREGCVATQSCGCRLFFEGS